ncbi:MAG TPA: hypothetical protein VNA57_12290 [Acidimicrobiales bacterium]|nr:hypothetical protein [Acidimicrobiales bacterium]
MADRKRFAIRGGGSVVGVLALAMLLNALVPSGATANHQPANKFGAAGSTTEEIGANDERVILDETMKVPSTHDLAIAVTAECSILTALQTGELPGGPSETSDRAYAFGQVEVFVKIDGTPVPVSTSDINSATPGIQTDTGEVVFCNRAYERRVTDSENQDGAENDGIDTEEDYIRTRAANAFNWMAVNIGRYDKRGVPAGTGTNVVKIEVVARYKTEAAENGAFISAGCGSAAPLGETCAEAVVGKRTLIAEPTNLSVHEQVQPVGAL